MVTNVEQAMNDAIDEKMKNVPPAWAGAERKRITAELQGMVADPVSNSVVAVELPEVDGAVAEELGIGFMRAIQSMNEDPDLEYLQGDMTRNWCWSMNRSVGYTSEQMRKSVGRLEGALRRNLGSDIDETRIQSAREWIFKLEKQLMYQNAIMEELQKVHNYVHGHDWSPTMKRDPGREYASKEAQEILARNGLTPKDPFKNKPHS